MGLKDRDYMKRLGRDDPYHNQLEQVHYGTERYVAADVRSEWRSPRGFLARVTVAMVIIAIGVLVVPTHLQHTPHGWTLAGWPF